MNLYDRIFKPTRYELENGKWVEEKFTRTPLILLILIIASAISVKVTGFQLSTIFKRGNQFFVMLEQMFPPNIKYQIGRAHV